MSLMLFDSRASAQPFGVVKPLKIELQIKEHFNAIFTPVMLLTVLLEYFLR